MSRSYEGPIADTAWAASMLATPFSEITQQKRLLVPASQLAAQPP